MPRNDRSPLLDGILDDIQRLGPFASIDETNRRLADQAHAYNTRPQADLGGLSPLQMEELLHGDWSTAGALRLDASLSFEDVGNTPLLADARTLLQFVVDHGP